jgi:hypothetical protein
MLHLATAHQNDQDNCPNDRHSDRSETAEAVGKESEHLLDCYRRSSGARLLMIAPGEKYNGFAPGKR